MKLSEQFTKKKILWLAGTLLIGALGSGLWEALIKPGMLWFVTLMLDLGTLGLSSLRDEIYLDVAKGSYDRSGLTLLYFATVLLCAILTAPIMFALFFRKLDENGRPTSKLYRAFSNSWAFSDAWNLFTVPSILAVILFVNLFRVDYTVRAATYVDQLIRITSPYITEQDRLLYQSELSQVSNRDDYVRLVSKVKIVAASHKLRVPKLVIY